MRYLILTPSAGGRDGIASLTRRVAIAISELGGDVEIWSLSEEPGTVLEVGEKSFSVRGAGGAKARIATWSLASLLRDCRDLTVVVMHAHLAPLCLPLRARRARIFHVLHGIEIWKPLSALQARAFRVAERLLCVSAHSARAFDRVNPGFEKTLVCHSGLPDRADRADSGQLGDDGFALIVGRMASSERYKGHDVLLDVWVDVIDAAPQAKLMIVGDGDDRERLAEKSKELGLSNVVKFTGSVSDEELERLYARCSFFVMPSVNEGFGLVFLEAMRASKACIGGVGAASEIIENGTTGFIVDPHDGAALTRNLAELFHQSDRRAEMGARGRKRFERCFTSAHFRERLESALGIEASG